MSKQQPLSKSLQISGLGFLVAVIISFMIHQHACPKEQETPLPVPDAPSEPNDSSPIAPARSAFLSSHEATVLEETVADLQKEFDWLYDEHQRLAAEHQKAVLEGWPTGEIELLQQNLDELIADMHDRAVRIYEHSARLGELHAASALERLKNL